MILQEILLKLATASPAKLHEVYDLLNGAHLNAARDDERTETRLITQTDAAQRLNLSRPTIYRLIQSGRLETVVVMGQRRVTLQSVLDYAKGA